MTSIRIHVQPVQRLPDDYVRCYGIGCPQHGRCLRYLAIDGDTAWRPQYIGTCGEDRQLYMERRQ